MIYEIYNLILLNLDIYLNTGLHKMEMATFAV